MGSSLPLLETQTVVVQNLESAVYERLLVLDDLFKEFDRLTDQ